MSPRLPALDGPPIGFAHRGTATAAAENTIESFRMALEQGATGIESDLWATADGVPVLHRDGKVGSRLRRRPIAKIDRHHLPPEVPTFAELCQLVSPEFPLALNIRDPAAFDVVLAESRAPNGQSGSEDRLLLCHPDLSQLTRWRPGTSAKLINSINLASVPNGLERRAAELNQRGIDGLSMFHREWSGGRVTLFHRFGLRAHGWGAQYEREVAELVDAGIDGVHSAHIDRMMAVIHEYYKVPPTGGA